MHASKADRTHLSISTGEGQAICDAVNVAVSAIADLAVVIAVVYKGHRDIEIDSARQRYAMLR
jgi:hypothetical protein